MKTWRVEVIPRVEQRLIDILTYISDNPLYNPDAAVSVLEDFEATVKNNRPDGRPNPHRQSSDYA